jgi:hypothetical protein
MANMTDVYPEDTAIQISSISGHTSQAVLYVVTVIFTIVACLAIVARLVARILVVKQPGSDDAFISIAGILSVAFCVTTYKQTEFGMVSGLVAAMRRATRQAADSTFDRASISGSSQETNTRSLPCGSGRLSGYTTPPLVSPNSPFSFNSKRGQMS